MDGRGAKAHTRAAFAFIFITAALDMLALGVMVPVLPSSEENKKLKRPF